MLQPFNIIFHKGKTPIARFIRLLTRSKFSHCAITIDSLHLIQLDWKTPVTLDHFAYPLGQYDVYEVITPLSDIEKQMISRYMRDRISTTYDWKFILSRFFNITLGTPIISSKKKYNCDELILEAFRHIGVNLIEDDVKLTPDTLSKSKLLRVIKEVE